MDLWGQYAELTDLDIDGCFRHCNKGPIEQWPWLYFCWFNLRVFSVNAVNGPVSLVEPFISPIGKSSYLVLGPTWSASLVHNCLMFRVILYKTGSPTEKVHV